MAFKAKEDGPMSSQRHKPEEIVAKLRQVEVLVAPGTPVADAIRSIGVTEVEFCPIPQCSKPNHLRPKNNKETPDVTRSFSRGRPWRFRSRARFHTRLALKALKGPSS